MKMNVRKMAGMAVAVVLMSAGAGGAAIFTIADNNSTATVDATSGQGMSDWNVEGIHHMEQQWFWYRVGAAGPESNVSTLPLTASGVSDTNYDGANETLFLRYATANFKVELTFLLAGGTPGSGMSDIGESIRIVNTGAQALDFHFFQYCDLDLNGTPMDSSVRISNGNTATQTDGPVTVSETVEVPGATHFEAGMFPTTLNSLNDGLPTTLSNTAGPIGPGDLTWAFQWDFNLAPGGAYLISKDKYMVPEPATLSLLALGALAVIRRRHG